MSENSSAIIFEHASLDLGLKETPGKRSTPRISLAIELAAKWLDPDDTVTAWCGCIRGLWGLETGTGVPVAHYRAKSWLTWGRSVKLSDAQQGDTVILRRPGGGHVGLVESPAKDGLIRVLGGNQKDAVRVDPFLVSNVVGIRRK